MSDRRNRRQFINAASASLAAIAGAPELVARVQAAEAQVPAASPAPVAAVSHAYTFLTAPEAAFVETAVDRLIPADELTPGGTDCGVAIFIDRQLAGAV